MMIEDRGGNGYAALEAAARDLAEAASKLPAPKTVPLKDPKDFKLIGKHVRRTDAVAKTNGKAKFTCRQAGRKPGQVVSGVRQGLPKVQVPVCAKAHRSGRRTPPTLHVSRAARRARRSMVFSEDRLPQTKTAAGMIVLSSQAVSVGCPSLGKVGEDHPAFRREAFLFVEQLQVLGNLARNEHAMCRGRVLHEGGHEG